MSSRCDTKRYGSFEHYFPVASAQGASMAKKCIVIGAGLSGLAAAHALVTRKNAEKWEVVVLEARNRIGGRVYTYKFHEAPELYCELGGEWVGEQHDAMIALCAEFQLPLIPHRFDYSFVDRGKLSAPIRAGAWPLSEKAGKIYDAFTKEFLAHADDQHWQARLDRDDWWTVLRNAGFSREDLLHRDLMDSTDFGETIRMVGGYSAAAEYLEPGSSNPYDEMDMRIEGGNTRLVNALARAVGLEHIHTCMEVQTVTERNGLIEVTARDNRADEFEHGNPGGALRVFPADACICTVPARTLIAITFDPPLPKEKIDAANELQYCRIMKTVMLLEERFWLKGDCDTRFSCFTDVNSDFLFDATLLQPGPQGILCSYAIGDKADDLASRGTEALRTVLEQDLSAIFPAARTKILAIERYAWQGDKYTQGAYAFYRPGQWFKVREPLTNGLHPDKKLGFPHGKILFAGEHIADEQGFMEGAVDTGQKAAGLL